MPQFNPAIVVEQLEQLRNQYSFCPNRVWRACSQIRDWESKQSTLQEILDGVFPKDSLRHENHAACSLDFCEFSSRNFTAVQQYHEPTTCDQHGKTRENHEQKHVCFRLQSLFNDDKLVEAAQSDKLTAWRLDGWSVLEHPRPFMAISHVWSDGTGAGTWPSKQVNECVYRYFKKIAKRFQCEGIWWDTLCVPQDRHARSRALSIMHQNYEEARVTLVHDRFLRNIPFTGPDMACLAIVLSSWFTRGWTALELAKSRNVKIIFRESIKDLDKDILNKANEQHFAARAIKDLRRDRFSNMDDLLAPLRPRYTSWLKDRATIAANLIGMKIPGTDEDTFQRDMYQSIVKEIGVVSHDHLFHRSVTMPKGFSWCATDLFHLPHATTQQKLTINDAGEVSGSWGFLSIHEIDTEKCIWGTSHELIEAKLQYALKKESAQHLLLVKPPEERSGMEETRKGILVRIMKNPCQGEPRLKGQFVGSLYFSSALPDAEFVTEITIGDTEGWEMLDEDGGTWGNRQLLPNNPTTGVRGVRPPPIDELETNQEWGYFHRAAWLGDEHLTKRVEADLAKQQKDDRLILLQQRDKLGRQAIHLAAERGHIAFVEILLEWGDDPKSRIFSHFSEPGDESPDNGQTPLHRAAWGGFLEMVELLLDRGSDASDKDEMGNTALHIAADMGFGEVVGRLCEEAQLSVDVRGRNGLTPLHYAALGGHYDVAEVLTTRGATLDAKDYKIGWTPLHCAVESGQVSVIELLLGNGAEITNTDERVGWTPLHFAAMSGQTAAVQKLIEGADINKEDENGFTPLIFAAINGHPAVVESLISHGATIGNSTFDWSLEEVKDSEGVIKWLTINNKKFGARVSTAKCGRIYLAALDRYTTTTRLIDDDIDISGEMGGNGDLLLNWAASDGRLSTVRLLKQMGIGRLGGTDKSYETMPLFWAATGGHDDVARELFYEIETEVIDALMGEAVPNGHEVAVRTLLRVGADTEARISDGKTLLFKALHKGNEGTCRALCEAGANKEAKDGRGNTPLLLAAGDGGENKDIVRILIEAGADIEATNEDGDTPLLLTAKKGDLGMDVAQMLIEAGANIEATNESGSTPLSQAAFEGDSSQGIVELLLHAGANIEAEDGGGDTPLLRVAGAKGEIGGLAQMMIGAGANVDAVNNKGATPLLVATKTRKKGVVHMLLEAGANKDASDDTGNTPLLEAVSWRDGEEIVQMLLRAGANIDAGVTRKPGTGIPTFPSTTGGSPFLYNGSETPLLRAARSEHDKIVQILLEAGANKEAADDRGNTALILAAEHSPPRDKSFSILLQAGTNIEARNNDGDTPLLRAVKSGRADSIRMMLQEGVNIEAANNKGDTPLLMAAEGGDEVIRILLEAGAGANIEARNNDGDTPLLKAAAKYFTERTVQLLVQAGANIEARNNDGDTPLLKAAKEGEQETVRKLLQAGANIEARSNNGDTPLLNAAEKGEAVVRILLEAGANIEDKNNDGDTPLLKAALFRQKRVVQLLLQGGANMKAVNYNGDTLLLAEAKGEKRWEDFLKTIA